MDTARLPGNSRTRPGCGKAGSRQPPHPGGADGEASSRAAGRGTRSQSRGVVLIRVRAARGKEGSGRALCLLLHASPATVTPSSGNQRCPRLQLMPGEQSGGPVKDRILGWRSLVPPSLPCSAGAGRTGRLRLALSPL